MDLFAISIPLYLLLILLEAGYGSWKKMNLYRFNDTISNLNTGILSLIYGLGPKAGLFFLYIISYEKLRIFDNELAARNQAAGLYRLLLEDRVAYQDVPPGFTSAWAQFSVLHKDRDAIMATLRQQGVPTAVYYPRPLHCQTAFAHLGYAPDDFPVSLHLSRNIFSLPMHPYLKEADIRKICDLIR